MKLHPAIGKNRYCGPAALAILSGLDTAECARLLRVVSGKRAIMRIGDRYMIRVMSELQISNVEYCAETSLDPTRRGVGLTLDNWMDAVPSACYLVVVTGHYVVVDTDAGVVCDNGTVYPLAIDRYRMRRKHVRRAWRILNGK